MLLTTSPNGPYHRERSWGSERSSRGKAVGCEPGLSDSLALRSALQFLSLILSSTLPPLPCPLPPAICVFSFNSSRVLRKQRSAERKNLAYRGLNPISASGVTLGNYPTSPGLTVLPDTPWRSLTHRNWEHLINCYSRLLKNVLH